MDTILNGKTIHDWLRFLFLLDRLEQDETPKEKEMPVEESEQQFEKLVAPSADSHKFELLPTVQVIIILLYILAGVHGAYTLVTAAKFPTVVFTLCMLYSSVISVTAGAHRLWSHRAYKAKMPLEILLIVFYLMANQNTIVYWAKNHRLHHWCSDTDADPHNAARGFFFSHMGWQFVKPHPEYLKRRKVIDVSDLMRNPLIRFEEKYSALLLFVLPIIVPAAIPLLWGESLAVASSVNFFRLNLASQIINLINSAAHLIGYKPVDTSVAGTQYPFVGAVTFGEGFHNYHHVFPYDYRASELGDVKLNLTTRFIDFFAKIGWAYDLKTTSEETVRNRVLRKGDGTDPYYVPDNEGKQEFMCLKYYKCT